AVWGLPNWNGSNAPLSPPSDNRANAWQMPGARPSQPDAFASSNGAPSKALHPQWTIPPYPLPGSGPIHAELFRRDTLSAGTDEPIAPWDLNAPFQARPFTTLMPAAQAPAKRPPLELPVLGLGYSLPIVGTGDENWSAPGQGQSQPGNTGAS